VQMATYHGLLSVLPQIVASQLRAHGDYQKNESVFFEKWPALKAAAENPQSLKTITNAISSFRQLNPQATLEDTIAQAGLLAMMSLRLPLPMPGAPAPAAVNGNAGTTVPVAPPALQATPPVPPRPPGIGTTGHVPMAPSGSAEENIFTDLVEAHERGVI